MTLEARVASVLCFSSKIVGGVDQQCPVCWNLLCEPVALASRCHCFSVMAVACDLAQQGLGQSDQETRADSTRYTRRKRGRTRPEAC